MVARKEYNTGVIRKQGSRQGAAALIIDRAAAGLTGGEGDIMKAYTGSTYESTRILNPEAPWREAISGGYEGGISVYSLSLPLAAELRKALRSIALKQDDERKAADLLTLCADIADSMQEAEKRAKEREAEALQQLDAWKAEKTAQEAQEGAEAPEEV